MYLISNRNLCSKEKYIKTIVEAAKNNVEYLILREKDLKYSELEKLYNEIVSELKENKADINIIVNSSIELYENYPVYGVHLPYNLFKDLISRGYKFNKNKKIGLSLHSTHEVIELNKIIESKKIDIDYITLSHIFDTKCKEGLTPKGVDLLKNAKDLSLFAEIPIAYAEEYWNYLHNKLIKPKMIFNIMISVCILTVILDIVSFALILSN